MKTKHKLINDFQYVSPEKKIFVLKSGTILEEYNYTHKGETIPIDRDIVENNPEFFTVVDWKSELLSYMRANKLPQPAQLGKKLIPFIEEMILSGMEKVETDNSETDNSRYIEIEQKETDLFKREQELERKRISLEQKEDENEIREKSLNKRDKMLKDDSALLDTRENTIREKSKKLIEKEFEIEELKRSIEEKERGLELKSMKNDKDIEGKYDEIQQRLEIENKKISERDAILDNLAKELEKRKEDIEYAENEIRQAKEEIEEEKTTLEIARRELEKFNAEITQWENTHWKFRRAMVPPSAIPESKNPDL
jgi:DNA repair exonuclease SbcCD ATPase subunit